MTDTKSPNPISGVPLEAPQGVAVPFDDAELAALDEWRADQPDWPGRPEAIRRLVAAGVRPQPQTRLRPVGPEDEDRRVKPGEAGANDD